MVTPMKRVLSGRQTERGDTLTGYALITSLLLVVSITGIQALNTSGGIVLADTATSVGNPRPPVEDVKTQPVPDAPAWAVSPDDGLCTPGIDGCPLGVQQVPLDRDAHRPLVGIPPLPAPDLPASDFNNIFDPDPVTGIFVAQESQVLLNGEFTPPSGDKPASGGEQIPATAQPGDMICSFIVHVSPGSGNGNVKYGLLLPVTVTFDSPIIGTAYDSGTDNNARTSLNGLFGDPDLQYRTAKLASGDKYSYSGNTLTLEPFNASNGGKDQVRVFTLC
jgi:hypothetical protein